MSWSISIFLSKTKVNDVNLWGNRYQGMPYRKWKKTPILKYFSHTWFARLPKPMRKLSGLISRCKNDLEWTNSTRLICNEYHDYYIEIESIHIGRNSMHPVNAILPSDRLAWEQSSKIISYCRNWINPQDLVPVNPSQEHCNLLQCQTI